MQAEDELASINMAIGGSYGGVPSLTATSGPGLSLMVEALGLAVAAEIPLVVVDVMRVGPSTGIPTKSEQGDLNIAVHGLHGDAPHLVLAPNSVADCLRTTQWAVQLAEALQSPAIVLSDQFLGQARAVVDRPADLAVGGGRRRLAAADAPGYRRYALTANGVSPMAIPGTAGLAYTADGLEHAERGTPSSQAADHFAQLDKRRRKLEAWDYGDALGGPRGRPGGADCADRHVRLVHGPGARRHSRAPRPTASRRGSSRCACWPRCPQRAWPPRSTACRASLVIEQNHSAQLYKYLRGGMRPAGTRHQPAPGGRAAVLSPDEIHRHLLEWSRA